MSEPKFSKGPFKYDEDGGAMWMEGGIGFSSSLSEARECEHVEFLSIVDANGTEIAQVKGPYDDSVIDTDEDDYLKYPCTDEQAVANAHLFAAASDLFDALERAVEQIKRYGGDGLASGADAALAKARGEA